MELFDRLVPVCPKVVSKTISSFSFFFSLFWRTSFSKSLLSWITVVKRFCSFSSRLVFGWEKIFNCIKVWKLKESLFRFILTKSIFGKFRSAVKLVWDDPFITGWIFEAPGAWKKHNIKVDANLKLKSYFSRQFSILPKIFTKRCRTTTTTARRDPNLGDFFVSSGPSVRPRTPPESPKATATRIHWITEIWEKINLKQNFILWLAYLLDSVLLTWIIQRTEIGMKTAILYP